jgi:hypothetical protein
MTKQIINVGIADKGNGDPIRTAFQKVNSNFNELYGLIGGGSDTTDIIKDTAAEMLVEGVHNGITVNYNATSKVIKLSVSTVSTGAVSIDMDGGAAATIYDLIGLNIDGGSASSAYSTASTISGGGA